MSSMMKQSLHGILPNVSGGFAEVWGWIAAVRGKEKTDRQAYRRSPEQQHPVLSPKCLRDKRVGTWYVMHGERSPYF